VKIFRVIQLLALGALIGYLVVLHNVNPQIVILPFLISLPVSWAVGASLLLGFLVGWLAVSGHAWRLARENRVLRQKLVKAGSILEPTLTERDAGRRPRTRREASTRTERGADEPPAPPERDLASAEDDPSERGGRRWGRSNRDARTDLDARNDLDEEL
jgi:hypothetical protein